MDFFRSFRCEAHVSTQQTCAQKAAWISCAYGHCRGAESDQCPSCTRTQEAFGLNFGQSFLGAVDEALGLSARWSWTASFYVILYASSRYARC